ncbi:MAG TPA: hypothetical protein VK038_02970 [Ornithinicoccus sp.]|jgi:hypothetical protein|nr:hypothetical protein [Ornithinicoccus sp.]
MAARSRRAAATPQRARRTGLRVALGAVVLAGAVVAGSLGARWALAELAAPVCELRGPDGTEELTPEQAANAATIAGVALQRGLDPHAVTIALATAIQESKLRNLTYGDADSLGLFQQRPSQGWGSAEEVRDPVYASRAFYDALVEVPDWQDGRLTEVAQAVQRSAYPEAYADHEDEGRTMAAALTGAEPAAVGCRLDDPEGPGSAEEVLAKAERQLGATGSVSGDTVTLQADDETTVWALAAWAVAHADAEHIVRVEAAGRTWDRTTDPLSWQEAGGTVGLEVAVTVAGD